MTFYYNEIIIIIDVLFLLIDVLYNQGRRCCLLKRLYHCTHIPQTVELPCISLRKYLVSEARILELVSVVVVLCRFYFQRIKKPKRCFSINTRPNTTILSKILPNYNTLQLQFLSYSTTIFSYFYVFFCTSKNKRTR